MEKDNANGGQEDPLTCVDCLMFGFQSSGRNDWIEMKRALSQRHFNVRIIKKPDS